MKKIFITVLVLAVAAGCSMENEFLPREQEVAKDLKIESATGIKVENAFVTTEVAMNVKSEVAGKATIKIFNIANRVVSKEEVEVNVGNNVYKVYTSALPSSAYRLAFYDSNNKMVGITDFNKL